jgi:hypothetical protein
MSFKDKIKNNLLWINIIFLLVFVFFNHLENFYIKGKYLFVLPFFNLFNSTFIAIFSSSVFYYFYSYYIEKIAQEEIHKKASEQTLRMFQEKFENIIPEKIYEYSDTPTRSFNKHFIEALKNSDRYFYKGDLGESTSIRLEEIVDSNNINKDVIVINLINPKNKFNNVWKTIARQKLDKKPHSKSKIIEEEEESIQKEIAALKLELFVTLLILFELSNRVKIDIVLSSTAPAFYVHSLTKGLFLSFYLGEEYPQTYFYNNKTTIYEAFRNDCSTSKNSAETTFKFDDGQNKEDFLNNILKEYEFSDVITNIKSYYQKSEVYKNYKISTAEDKWIELLRYKADIRREKIKNTI